MDKKLFWRILVGGGLFLTSTIISRANIFLALTAVWTEFIGDAGEVAGDKIIDKLKANKKGRKFYEELQKAVSEMSDKEGNKRKIAELFAKKEDGPSIAMYIVSQYYEKNKRDKDKKYKEYDLVGNYTVVQQKQVKSQKKEGNLSKLERKFNAYIGSAFKHTAKDCWFCLQVQDDKTIKQKLAEGSQTFEKLSEDKKAIFIACLKYICNENTFKNAKQGKCDLNDLVGFINSGFNELGKKINNSKDEIIENDNKNKEEILAEIKKMGEENLSDEQILCFINQFEEQRDFLGRENELGEIKNNINDKIIVLHGIGGNGKTSLAEKFLSSCKDVKISKVVFSGNDNNESAMPLYQEFLDNIKLQSGQIIRLQNCRDIERDLQKRILLEKLSSNVILFLDNIDTLTNNFLEKLKELNCKIIITTRFLSNEICQNNEKRKIIAVKELDELTALTLFKNVYGNMSAREEDVFMDKVYPFCFGNPKALQFVAKMCNYQEKSITDFVDMMRNGDKFKIDDESKAADLTKNLMNFLHITNFVEKIKEGTAYYEILSAMRAVEQIGVNGQALKGYLNLRTNNEVNELIEIGIIEKTSFTDILSQVYEEISKSINKKSGTKRIGNERDFRLLLDEYVKQKGIDEITNKEVFSYKMHPLYSNVLERLDVIKNNSFLIFLVNYVNNLMMINKSLGLKQSGHLYDLKSAYCVAYLSNAMPTIKEQVGENEEMMLVKNKEEIVKIDILDVLLDEKNTAPIYMHSDKGVQLAFDQIAVIPGEDEEDLYCILKPIDKIEGIRDNEAVVFKVAKDGEEHFLIVEENEGKAMEIFSKYYDLLVETTSKDLIQ